MKVLIAVCDRCSKLENLALHSEDGQHHLCEGCVTLFLRAIFNPSYSEVIPFEEGEEVTCAFCSVSWLAGSATKPFLFQMNGGFVCDPCLLEAARKMGNLRLVRDSVRDC